MSILPDPRPHLRKAASSVLGEISWHPPAWWPRATVKLHAHRQPIANGALAAILLLSVGYWFYDWYQHRPQPHRVTVTIDAIPVTKVENELHPTPLCLRFNESAAPLQLIERPVTSGVRLDPTVKGEWRWENDRVLAFKPAQDWPAETTYRVTLAKDAVAPHTLLDRYEVETTTPAFTATLRTPEFYQHPEDPTVKQVTATIEFSHPVDEASLGHQLKLAMIGGANVLPKGEPPFALTFGLHHRVAYLRTPSIALPEREDFMKVTLAKGVRAARNDAETKDDLEAKVRVPDVFSFFRIEAVKGQLLPNNEGVSEQLLFITTTAAVKSEELAKALKVVLLPTKPQNPNGREPKWKSASEVDEAALENAIAVTTTLVPGEHENARQHAFKITVEAEGSLHVTVAKGARALGDYLLRDNFTTVLPVPELKPEIVIEGEGGVLALNGERKIAVRSRGVSVIDYEVARVPADQINHLVSQTRGEFQDPEFQSYQFNEQNIARIAHERQAINLTSRYTPNYSSFDFSGQLAPADQDGKALQGLFFINAREWHPPKQVRKPQRQDPDDEESNHDESMEEEEEREDNLAHTRRFILVTDLGLIVKENGDDSRDVFIASIKDGAPLGGIAVDVLAKNGVVLVNGTTDGSGRVTFPSLGKLTKEKQPVAFVARRGNDVAFMPFDREDRQLDFSRFDIEGVESMSGSELDAFVFTERGIYRPGDEIHGGVIVKQRDWQGQLAGLPIEIEIIDARGQTVQSKKVALPESGFTELSYQTAHESPSGSYTMNAFLVRETERDLLLGSARATVKEFLPDRMKMTSRLSKENPRGWVTPDDMHAAISLHNLYGTPTADHRVKGSLRLSPTGFQFDEWKDYTFFDRLRDTEKEVTSQDIELGDTDTDEEGACSFDLDLERFADATYEMWFTAEGFEADSGRSVSAANSVRVSPLPYVVGTKAEGNLCYISMGSERAIDLIALNSALEPMAVPGLQCNIIEQAYVSILTKLNNGDLAYESVLRERIVHAETVNLAPDGLHYLLPTKAPGTYVLELRDAAGARVTKLTFTVVGRGDVSRSVEKNAELEIKLSKPEYNAGEEIEISIVAPYTGSGLITIERDKVYAHAWFKADATSSTQRIRLPEDFEGTGYINVSFIRGLGSKEVFMSPLSYGVMPFKANIARRRLPIELHGADKVRPGEALKITYKTDRPSKIVIFAVDQGILQVTGYKLPDPLAHFFRKCALTVGTSQIVDLIMPEFSLWRSASAFGGDDGHLNPFKRVTEKPVVFWSGVIDADATDREVTYNVPDYFDGTLTIMAVAVSDDAVGTAERNCLVRGPFVITPSAPTVAAPGDVFEIGVTVANGVEGSGENAAVMLHAESSGHVEVLKSPPQPLTIPEGREETVSFTVRAREKLGAAEVTFHAAFGAEKVARRSTLSVRPPAPLMTGIRSGNFTKASIDVPITRTLRPEFRKLEASVSALPLGLARGLDRYLQDYPHGCSEQITSSAFCRLVLSDESDFGLNRGEVHAQLEKTFATLARRQNDKGAFGYWAPEPHTGIEFMSVYAMHFLSEAKAANFPPPTEMFAVGLRNLQTMVTKEPANLAEARTLAYDIYVLTREGLITTNYILNLRDSLEKMREVDWSADLLGVYLAGAYSMLQKQGEGQKLIKEYSIGRGTMRERNDFYQPLSADAQFVAIAARHFPEVLKKITPEDFQAIIKPVSSGNFSTLSAAYGVFALKSYSQLVAQSGIELSIAELSHVKMEKALPAAGGLLKEALFSERAAVLRFAAQGDTRGLGAFYQVLETGYDLDQPQQPVRDGLEVFRELVDKNGALLLEAPLGEPVTVRVRSRSIGRGSITNTAIVDLLPGGFEIVSSSLQPGVSSLPGVEFVELREDRAVFFGTIEPVVREFTYLIKATNRGTFTVPPVFAESMYDRGVKARGSGSTITVVDVP